MACVPAPACRAMLDEASRLWPNRDKASDGICASPAHHKQDPTSDHETGDAVDLTHDPAHGVDCAVLSRQILGDARVHYVIFNRQIWNRDRASEGWRAYHGVSPHTEHMHVSIEKARRNETGPWFSLVPVPPASPTAPHRRPRMILAHQAGTGAVFLFFGRGNYVPIEDPADRDAIQAAGVPHVELTAPTFAAWTSKP